MCLTVVLFAMPGMPNTQGSSRSSNFFIGGGGMEGPAPPPPPPIHEEKPPVVITPYEEDCQKIAFIFNNISKKNLTEKKGDLLKIVTEEYWPWVAQYLVSKVCY